MRPKFINTAWVHTRERLVLRGGAWAKRIALQVRVGIIEREDGIVLIDAGYGPESVTAPDRSLALRLYSRILSPELRSEGEPATALAALGYAPEDVSSVILTHFHADHVSALARFPNARLMVHGPTYQRMVARTEFANLHRGIFTELLPMDMATRLEDVCDTPKTQAPLGLGPAQDVFGDGTVLAVDLPGHAEGHFGLCFVQMDPPLLYATDTQWLLSALPGRIPGFPATLASEDQDALRETALRVDRFRQAGGEVMLCHDPAMTAYDMESGA